MSPAGLDRWDRVLRLPSGCALEVTRRDGTVVHGAWRSADAGGLILELPSGATTTVATSGIDKVLMIAPGPDSLWNGALIGAAVGVGYALSTLAYIASGEGGEPTSVSWIAGPLIGAGIGAAVGALVDRARSGQERVVVYSRVGTR